MKTDHNISTSNIPLRRIAPRALDKSGNERMLRTIVASTYKAMSSKRITECCA